MTRIASLQSQQSALLNLQRAQSREAQAGAQVASGKLGDDHKAYGRGSEGIAALKSVQARVGGWRDAVDGLTGRLEMQDLMLNTVLEGAGDARQAITEALGADRGDDLMAAIAGAFTKVASGLNARYDGKALFGGARLDEAPLAADTLADLTAIPAADLFRNDGLKASVRLGEQTIVGVGELASETGAGVMAAFRDVQAYVEANGPFGRPLAPAQRDFLQGAIGAFDAAQDGIRQVVARNGAVQKRVDGIGAELETRSISLKAVIGDRTEVDPAEAISRLEQARIAVQASAQVFATLRGTSLLDLLR
jgi:flagellar hook-associated protein 3 FlgL